jgi:hypothetical protein
MSPPAVKHGAAGLFYFCRETKYRRASMSEFWQQLLLQIVVSFVAGLVGGGLISAYIDWMRFRREEEEIEREEQRVSINSIRSVIAGESWRLKKSMSDKGKLYVLMNDLEGTVNEYGIVAEFVIRNLTDDEVIITSVEVKEPGLPPFFDAWRAAGNESDDAHEQRFVEKGLGYIEAKGTDFEFYDMKGFYDWTSKEEIGRVRERVLSPRETLQVAYVAVRRFFAIRRMAEAPNAIIVAIHSTEGHKVEKTLELAEGWLPRSHGWVEDYKAPAGSYEDVVRLPEEEIPF